MNFTILHFDSIASTNTEALKQARLGAAEGLCIVARQQTEGRGRHGRTWESPKDAGLYMSIIVRPKFDARQLPLITLMSGVAVHDVLSELGLKPDIKWPNDIYVSDKKICGILAEAAETETGLAIVVGIGINLTSRSFPDDLAETATSVEAESKQKAGFANLERSIIKFFGYFYEMLCESDGPRQIIQHWKQRSTYYCGKDVRVTIENDIITGTTDGLEQNGALRVRRPDGSVAIIQTGDVEKLRTA